MNENITIDRGEYERVKKRNNIISNRNNSKHGLFKTGREREREKEKEKIEVRGRIRIVGVLYINTNFSYSSKKRVG
jgi:hypothetical protein